MMVRRSLRAAAAGSLAALALGLLAGCDSSTHATASATAGTSAPAASPSPTPSVKTLPPSELCTVLTTGVARTLVPTARLTARVQPNKGTAPDVCDYSAPDGTATLSLTPATRTYAAELSAAHDLSAHPAAAGMSKVLVDPVSGLGTQAFRETAYQTQARQSITFVVWNAGTRNWVLTLAKTSATPTTPPAATNDPVVKVARTLTAKLPTKK
ncbi:hypothetical protein [Streptomyces sp. NPDC087212]|uniref:hypothetical protein n=1 Tax=Streptomyces sp. NPDC087212 TaxID=3365766 RepID=UPI0038262AB4